MGYLLQFVASVYLFGPKTESSIRSALMDKQSSQEHSIVNESDAFNRVARPNSEAMQLHLVPPVRICTSYLYGLSTILKMMVLGRSVIVDHSVLQPD